MTAERTTRRPTGLPGWPILLLAGAEGAGKSWALAEASGSELVGRTLWVPIGEVTDDEYGAIPGADFEFVNHDGTFRDIRDACWWAAEQPRVDGKPTLLVVDSGTCLWEQLSGIAQQEAYHRAREKASRGRGAMPASAEDVRITPDLWNTAADRWGHILDALRHHDGPSIITARLEEVTEFVNGEPTKNKVRSIKAQRSTPYDVTHIVEMPERGKAYLTKAKTTRMDFPERLILPGFTVDKLWRRLGIYESVGERHFARAVVPQAAPLQQADPQQQAAAQAYRQDGPAPRSAAGEAVQRRQQAAQAVNGAVPPQGRPAEPAGPQESPPPQRPRTAQPAPAQQAQQAPAAAPQEDPWADGTASGRPLHAQIADEAALADLDGLTALMRRAITTQQLNHDVADYVDPLHAAVLNVVTTDPIPLGQWMYAVRTHLQSTHTTVAAAAERIAVGV